ncbi:MAG: FtsX-like permease family protein, partial [bacterium]|nr:FtsX-like permease family protein [bacterium]
SEDPVGKNILFEDGKYVLEVTGIIKDIPENSQMYFDFILRLDALERIYSDWWKSDFTEWKDQNVMTYLMTSENFSQYEFEEKLNNYIKVNTEIPEREYFLQPLKKAHLYSDFPRDPANRGRININNIYFFLIISVSVLLIACINFMNLSTARSLKRSKEVGIRKVNGAQRRDLILQYMGESFFYTISALLLAFLLSVFLLPVLREFTGKQIDLSLINIWQFLGSTLIVIIITGFVSGIYPALFLSSFEPVKVMKGILNPRNSSFLKMRRFLLAFQFFCTISLLIITIIIYSQLDFIKNKDLGFQSKDIVSLGFNRELFNQCVPFKAELLKHPGIANVTSGLPPTNDVMGHGPPTKYDWEGKNPERDIEFDFMFVDFGYDKVFELKMAEGRFYSQDHPGDLNMYVLNEAAIKAMKITNPIGKKFTMSKSEGEIIGVVKDFHTGTLKTKIKPTVFILRPNFGILVKFTPGDNGNAINYIEETWGEFVNEIPFDYDYIEDRLASFYSGDRKTWDMLRSFTILIFFISCMGLFGLISFVTEQKTKEIGIRKTFGASVSGIVGLISKEFFLLILIANCIAWPSAYFIISRWLQNFAYRIDPGWSVFMLSGLVVLMVTLLTIIYQTVKAATANPVDSIRYE